VITQPDRPRGRGHEISFSPVKETALAANLPIVQPEKIRTPESEKFLNEANPDAIVIIAYGQIIPARLLNIPKLGWINSHASLLPKYRGAAPIQWAIANGEAITGVTTMRIDVGMDTGEMLLQKEIPIAPDETTPQLSARLSELSGPLMAETLRALRDGTIQPKQQNHAEATTAPLLKKEDGRINWNLPAQTIYNRMRAFTPWPGAYTAFRGTTCQLTANSLLNSADNSACPASVTSTGAPGTIHIVNHQLIVCCGGQTFLHISRVKPEGRKEISAQEFVNGVHLQQSDRFI
jgi:methionyl-tRNA formyltransferase